MKVDTLIFFIGIGIGMALGGTWTFIVLRTQDVLAWWRSRGSGVG